MSVSGMLAFEMGKKWNKWPAFHHKCINEGHNISSIFVFSRLQISAWVHCVFTEFCVAIGLQLKSVFPVCRLWRELWESYSSDLRMQSLICIPSLESTRTKPRKLSSMTYSGISEKYGSVHHQFQSLLSYWSTWYYCLILLQMFQNAMFWSLFKRTCTFWRLWYWYLVTCAGAD